MASSRGGTRKHGLERFINSDLDKDNNSLARVSHEQAVAFLTNTGPTVLIKLIRETPVQVESSDDHVLPSATSSSISLTENLASSKGNILDVSRVSDFGIPAGSAADSAIKHGCAVYDGTQGRNHMPRTGKKSRERRKIFHLAIIDPEKGAIKCASLIFLSDPKTRKKWFWLQHRRRRSGNRSRVERLSTRNLCFFW